MKVSVTPLPPFLSLRPAAWGSLLLLFVLCAVGSGRRAYGQLQRSSGGNQLVVCQDGTVMGWGTNEFGQLGPNPYSVATPVAVPMPAGVRVVEVETSGALGNGAGSSYAILSTGQVLAWGANHWGQLGIGQTILQTPTPTLVVTASGTPLTGVKAVRAAREFTIALCNDGTVWSWGDNETGAFGDNSPLGTRRDYAQQIPSSLLQRITAIVATNATCFALNAQGTIYSWGSNPHGVLGLGLPTLDASGQPLVQATPAPISSLQNVRFLDGGTTTMAAIRTDGSVWVWGQNTNGQLGLGHLNSSSVPVQMPALVTGAANVSIHHLGGIAAMPNGSTYVWGDNSYGAIGLPLFQRYLTPVVGPTFQPGVQVFARLDRFMSLEPDGTLKSWGARFLGYPTTTPTPFGTYSAIPTTPPGLCLSRVASGPCAREYYHSAGSPLNLSAYVASQFMPAGAQPYQASDIGDAGQLTTLDAGGGVVTFDGVYHVRGPIALRNGRFVLSPQTVFYVEPRSPYRLQSYRGATICPNEFNSFVVGGYTQLSVTTGATLELNGGHTNQQQLRGDVGRGSLARWGQHPGPSRKSERSYLPHRNKPCPGGRFA